MVRIYPISKSGYDYIRSEPDPELSSHISGDDGDDDDELIDSLK